MATKGYFIAWQLIGVPSVGTWDDLTERPITLAAVIPTTRLRAFGAAYGTSGANTLSRSMKNSYD